MELIDRLLKRFKPVHLRDPFGYHIQPHVIQLRGQSSLPESIPISDEIKSLYYEDYPGQETPRGIQQYAYCLGYPSIDAFLQDISGHTVMDLGSGWGLFAAETYLHIQQFPSSTNKNTVIHSVNPRYGIPDYLRVVQSLEGEKRPDLYLWEPQRKRRGDTTVITYTSEDVIAAWKKAEEGFRSWNWNDLHEVASDSYDRVFSVFAFPFHSADLHFTSTSEFSGEFSFGPQSQQTLRELGRILKANGQIILTTDFGLAMWNTHDEFRQQFTTFIEGLGCRLAVRQNCFSQKKENTSFPYVDDLVIFITKNE